MRHFLEFIRLNLAKDAAHDIIACQVRHVLR